MNKTEICNQALIEAGIDSTISSIETDESVEALRCKRIYSQTKAECLSVYNWGFGTRFLNLAQVTPPNDSAYSYCFSFPNDILRLVSVYESTADAQANRNTLLYEVATRQTGAEKVIYCETATPVAKVMIDVDEVSLPPLFVRFLYLSLAIKIAKVSGADNSVKELLYNELSLTREQITQIDANNSNKSFTEEESYYIEVRT